jgi:hypothetical protein
MKEPLIMCVNHKVTLYLDFKQKISKKNLLLYKLFKKIKQND